jgi:hypothetical protein
MNGIDKDELDELVAKAFNGLKTALDSYSEKSALMYSHSLRALVQLRQQVIDEEK